MAAPAAWRRHLVPVLVLWCLALLAYSNSFRDGLVYDNHFVLQQDSRIREVSSANIWLILTKDYWYKTTVSSLYRPLATFSYLFNFAILGNGESPAGYHAINLFLHWANIALVYLLGWLLFAEFWPAFAMAALWAVHPVLTESVTNIVGRADLLAAFGVLAAVLCYARSLTDRRRATLWQLGMLAASGIAIFSKESGIVAIAAVFLYDIAWRRKAPRRARVMGYAAVMLPVAIFLFVRTVVLAHAPLTVVAFTDNPLGNVDFWTARLTAVKVLGRYLWLLLWPSRLSCDYSYNQIPLFSWSFDSWEDWQTIVSLVVYVSAAVRVAVPAYRRSKPVFFLVAFFFAAIAPTANIFLMIGTIMAERTLYLPSIAFAGCLAWGGWTLYQRLRPRWPEVRVVAPAVLTFACLAFCGRTFARNFDWFDEESLWKSAAKVVPGSYRSHEHLAAALVTGPAKDYDTADREAQRSVEILAPLPDTESVAVVYATAGMVYRLTGEARGQNGGADWYRKALQVLLDGKRVDQAWDREFTRRNQLVGKTVGHTHFPKVYLELARTYRDLGEYQNSLDALNPENWTDPQAEFFEEASATLLAMGNAPQAVIALLQGVVMGVPEQQRLAAEVVDQYRKIAPGTCALSGDQINFTCPLVQSQLCLAHRNSAAMYRQLNRDRDAEIVINAAETGLGCPASMFR